MQKYVILYYILEGEDKGMHFRVLNTNLNLTSSLQLQRAEKQLERKLKQGSLRIITYKKVESNN